MPNDTTTKMPNDMAIKAAKLMLATARAQLHSLTKPGHVVLSVNEGVETDVTAEMITEAAESYAETSRMIVEMEAGKE